MIEANRDTRPLVLVVDDDQAHRFLTRDALERAGFAVEEAAGGEQGLIAAERMRPDLVVLDVMMPMVDGYAVCAELRRKPEFMHLPILMVTAVDDVESIDRAFEAGATNLVTKPCNWTLLVYHIKYLLRSSQIEDELRKTKELTQLARASL